MTHPWLVLGPKIKAALATLVLVEAVIVAQWLRDEISGKETIAAAILAAAPVVAAYLREDDRPPPADNPNPPPEG